MAYHWMALVIGSLLAGACMVWLLALKRSRQPIVVLAGIGATIVSAWGLSSLISDYGTAEAVVTLSLVTLGCVAGGYGIASSLLGNTASLRRHSTLASAASSANRADTAVLVVACVEPQTYDTGSVALTLEQYEDAGLPEASIGMTPFLYAAQKARYRAAGGKSPASRQASSTVVRLEGELDQGTYGWVDLVTCQAKDRLDDAVARTVKRGYKRIVVAAITIAESFELDRAKTAVDTMRPDQHGISITYGSPLWSSDTIVDMVAHRVWASAQDEPEATGVALLMHGQPDAHQQTHAHVDVQENAFCNRVRMMLVEKGLPESNIRLCWMDWRQPDATETVRHLAALGCNRVLVVPACYPFDSMMTLLDLPIAVRQARVADHVYVTTLAAWGEDPSVAEALAEVVDAAAEELE